MSSNDPLESGGDDWTTVSKKRRSSRSNDSSKAEHVINAADYMMFRVPKQYKEEHLPRDSRDDILGILEGSSSVFPREAHHHLIPMLDALASLLVSRRSREIVAVALVPSSDRRKVTIHIAGSGSPDNLAKANVHLQDIWRIILGMRACSNPELYREKTPEVAGVNIDLATELVWKCYVFSRERLKKHIDKAKSNNMHVALQNLVQQAPQLLTPKQTRFVKELIYLFNLYDAYESDPKAGYGSVIRAVHGANAIRMEELENHLIFLDIHRESVLLCCNHKLNDVPHSSKFQYAVERQAI